MLGQIVHEFLPTPGHARSSEGAFIQKQNGNILFMYSRFLRHSADHAAADIYCLESGDGGLHFGLGRTVLAHETENAQNIMSVSLLRMQNGDIGLFYLARQGEEELYCYLRRSSDDGASFGPRTLCTPGIPGFWIVNNDRVVRLKSGRILIPTALHRRMRTAFEDTPYRLDPFSQVAFFYSDDDGYSWALSPCRVTAQNVLTPVGLQEPGVLELSDDVLWCFIRTGMGYYYESYSHDGGRHWTQAERSVFTGPESPLSAKRLPDGKVFAVWNPIPLYNGRGDTVQGVWTGRRTPLVCAFSNGNPREFTAPLLVENDPERGYCYTAIHPMRDAVLLAYCSGGAGEGSCLNKMTIRRIPYEAFQAAEVFRA